ncbi:LRR receptor-like serine/threonine-protein kinase fls2 [Phtheirospermum japonicum]|uniref:non-specific serine/threonine protein kinase n=1 Tax=Phtheirospermum japonicum TaxID=374723 RepID=A0A830D4S4_9LAMI|nr:LRR receptor-like serine/threonine-protein kinase fls2 [Phtheirospermum japonicum]
MERKLTFLVAIIVLLLVHNDQIMAMSLTNITTDKSALLTFKSHLYLSPSHILSKNWSANSASVCDWIGVTCGSRHQRVAALDLSMMVLTGTLVPHLGNLTFLVSLKLSSNKFHGVLPSELIRLRRLKVVDLRLNIFTGEIPSWLGSFPRLQILHLWNNSFIGFIPPSLSNASNLEVLDLSFNHLQGQIPKEIGNLHNLKSLGVDYNQLSGFLPLTLFNLSKMETLSLVGNSLSGAVPADMCRNLPRLEWLSLSLNEFHGQIPSNISECSQLRHLALAYNEFGGHIPREMGNLRMLEKLYLGTNHFTGAIPEEIGNLTILKRLDMGRNQLEGRITPQVFNISLLQFLSIHRNNMSGMLPADMCSHLKQLEVLFLSENEIFGPIPTRLYKCSSLQVLDLSANKLHGPIPPDIGNSTLLQVLGLNENKLTGEIPQGVGNLNNLEEIYLSINSLSGSIPLSLFNISALRIISLGYNQLTGHLPADLGYQLPNLEELLLEANYLTSDMSLFITSLANCKHLWMLSMGVSPLHGTLPASIGNLSTSMQYLQIFNCNLRGRIPEEIGNLTNLVLLSLNGIHLTGSFPKSLSNLQKLQGLVLSSNRLSGVIPDTICHLQKLNKLILRDNQIYGAIPRCIENITTLGTLYLDSNKLNHNIPASLWSLSKLVKLNLSSNSFVGPLPSEMANLKTASEIDLSLNQFSGVIPSAIGELQSLSSLNLSRNKLQGSIPESIANMINLETLDLSHNDLTGKIPKSLQKLLHLTHFNVSFNGLKGEIPFNRTFKNFTFESFMFNNGLCGDPEFHVPPCLPSRAGNPNRKKLRVLLISLGTFSSVILVLTLAYVGITIYQRKNKTPVIPKIMHSLFRETQFRVSYYELLRATEAYNESNLLGSGGFGSVYKGTLRNGKNVAVKVFNLQLEGAFKSFEVECEVLRNLRHRNLCKVIGCCSNQEFKALLLEYMPCGSLERWLYSHNHFLDATQRISIMIDVACALEYLHKGYSSPVIHCDLKPSNILLDEEMNAHLCDFGIAKLLGDGESVVQTMTLATLSYIAPEYGTGGFVSVKCDIYSFGIVLLEVFTRRRPTDVIFAGDMSLRSWVKSSMPNALSDIIDPNLLTRPAGEDHGSNQTLNCLSSLIEFGLNCSVESPHERMNIKDVIAALNKIKLKLLD